MHFERKNVYKACSPEETIDKVRKTLYEVGIFISENSIYNKESQTAACSLRFGDEAFAGTKLAVNGKGMTARYALASAHGEMMERLQSGMLFFTERKLAQAEGLLSYIYAPDEKMIQFSELAPEAHSSIKELLKMTEENWQAFYDDIKNISVVCLPYKDVINNTSLYLPVDLYYFLLTSNGLCAGNTRNEALSQGVSEVFERASLTEIYRNNPELMQLHPECFTGNEVIKKLNHLKTLGFEYKIIDASMGKEYPVIGLVLKKNEQIMFDLGGDPNPVVALERCLTELFQIITEGTYDIRLSTGSCGTYADWTLNTQKKWYHAQFMRAKIAGYGYRPDNLFNIPEKYSETYSYNSDNCDDLDYQIGVLKKLGYHLYVRDFSYLGFPAYQAFVPEISLGDFDYEDKTALLKSYMLGQIKFPCMSDETRNALLPIFKNLEERQEEYYKDQA